MERKRVKGRFVRENLDGDGGAKPKPKESEVAPPRPRYCRTFTRSRVAEALPEIIKTFTEKAAKGSIAHTKVLIKIGGLDTGDVTPKATKRRGKSVVRLLLDNLRDQDDEQPKEEPATIEPSEPDVVDGGSGAGTEAAKEA